MREIIFRGKTDKREWVYGSPVFQDGYVLIRFWNSEEFEYEEYLVIPESIGQYTGLIDKNGKKIFEGDIVRIGFEDKIWEAAREVVFEEGQWFFKCNSNSMKSYIGAWGNSVVEVIGNIHDNGELLGGD